MQQYSLTAQEAMDYIVWYQNGLDKTNELVIISVSMQAKFSQPDIPHRTYFSASG